MGSRIMASCFYAGCCASAAAAEQEALVRLTVAVPHDDRGTGGESEAAPEFRTNPGQAAPVAPGECEACAGPALTELRAWLETTLRNLSQKSALTEAIRYALARWDALERYITEGRIEIDNDAAERALRTAVLGRKNFLLAGSDAGVSASGNSQPDR